MPNYVALIAQKMLPVIIPANAKIYHISARKAKKYFNNACD
jgi:hypothetical protein